MIGDWCPLTACLLGLFGWFQPPIATVEPTPLELAAPNFYGAVANQLEVKWKITQEENILKGIPFVIHLCVDGVLNPHEVQPPRSWMSELQQQAQIRVLENAALAEVPDGRVIFAYQVIPNVSGELTLPSVAFAYVRPGFPEGRRLATAYADPVSCLVVDSNLPQQKHRSSTPQKFRSTDNVLLSRTLWLLASCFVLLSMAAFVGLGRCAHPVWRAYVQYRKCRTAQDIKVIEATLAADEIRGFTALEKQKNTLIPAVAAARFDHPARRDDHFRYAQSIATSLHDELFSQRLTRLLNCLARWTVALLLALMLSAATAWLLSHYESRTTRTKPAIYELKQGALLHLGPSAGYPTMLSDELPVGTQVQLLHTRADWYRVRLPDETKGWLPKTVLARTRTP